MTEPSPEAPAGAKPGRTHDDALVEAVTNVASPASPRVWATATVLDPEPGEPYWRSATSRHHRSTGYHVGGSHASPLVLSKLFARPAELSDQAVLARLGAFDFVWTRPVEVDPTKPVVLHACVIVTVGATRATLVDTQRGRLYLVPKALGELLAAARGVSLADAGAARPELDPQMLRTWYGILLALDLAVALDGDAGQLPEIELTHDEPWAIEAAIVDFDTRSTHDLATLAGELDGLGCVHLELRYFGLGGPDRIDRDLACFHGSRLRSVQVVAPWSDAWSDGAIEALCLAHARVALLLLYGAPVSRTLGGERYRAVLVPDVVTGASQCGQVHPLHFSFHLPAQIRSRVGDTCLFGKIGIDARGTIRNCPSHPVARGRLGEARLEPIVRSAAFRAPGQRTKLEVTGCRVCEFRSVCSHCQVLAPDPGSKPATCTYEPTEGRWA